MSCCVCVSTLFCVILRKSGFVSGFCLVCGCCQQVYFFVWSAPLSPPLIGIHSCLIIHTEVGVYSKLSTTRALTEIPLTANELFPYLPQLSCTYTNTRTENTYVHVSLSSSQCPQWSSAKLTKPAGLVRL